MVDGLLRYLIGQYLTDKHRGVARDFPVLPKQSAKF